MIIVVFSVMTRGVVLVTCWQFLILLCYVDWLRLMIIVVFSVMIERGCSGHMLAVSDFAVLC